MFFFFVLLFLFDAVINKLILVLLNCAVGLRFNILLLLIMVIVLVKVKILLSLYEINNIVLFVCFFKRIFLWIKLIVLMLSFLVGCIIISKL